MFGEPSLAVDFGGTKVENVLRQGIVKEEDVPESRHVSLLRLDSRPGKWPSTLDAARY